MLLSSRGKRRVERGGIGFEVLDDPVLEYEAVQINCREQYVAGARVNARQQGARGRAERPYGCRDIVLVREAVAAVQRVDEVFQRR